MRTIVLCGKPRGCCPEISIDENNILITDDYGGEVKFTTEEFELLKYKIMEKEL